VAVDVVALIGSLAACAVMAGVAALTGWRIDAVSRRGGGPDDYFWVAFGGVVVTAGVGVAGGAPGGPGAVLVGVVGVTATAAVVAWTWRRHDRRNKAAARAASTATWAGLRARHGEVLRRWADYDLDPAKAIHHPGMHDPRHPVGQPVIRALRAADAAHGGADAPDVERYAAAVDRLEQAFDTAESRLAAPRTGRGARHRALPS
jgi:hypothetical protein